MKPTDNNFDLLYNEMVKVWHGSQYMIDYSMKDYKRVVVLNKDNQFLAFNNPTIQTEFWFGYSDIGQGQTYDEANATMYAVSKNLTQYFIQRNTSKIEDMLTELRDKKNVFLVMPIYPNSNLVGVKKAENSVAALLSNNTTNGRLLTFEEREIVIKAYEVELYKLNKRLHAYLKRYGVSKLSVNRYWMDR